MSDNSSKTKSKDESKQGAGSEEGANMRKEIGSAAPHAEQDALNEEQTVATIKKAANSPRNDAAGNLELHEERSRDGPACATQNLAAPALSAARNPLKT